MTDTFPPNSRPVLGTATGAIGLGPYADSAEYTGPPEVILQPDYFRPFFATDARSVLVTLLPNHYNFVPNPAFRVDTTGWEITGLSTALDADSWVGQSLKCNGSGTLRYRAAADQFIYVGNLPGTTEEQFDYRRGGGEYTYSVYAKGAGKIRLNMDAYFPEDLEDLTSGPEYQNLPFVSDPTTEPVGYAAVVGPEGRVWKAIDPEPSAAPFYEDLGRPPAFESISSVQTVVENDGEWHRYVLRTRARVPEGNGQVTFIGARWIDGLIEIEDAQDLLISAVMLDSTEYPECAYFDGGMTEEAHLDDFLWEDNPDSSVSLYYYDRLIRTKWLCRYLPQVIPAGRPYQIFFGSYWRPFVCDTGETMMMSRP